jgi:hypothetical protein
MPFDYKFIRISRASAERMTDALQEALVSGGDEEWRVVSHSSDTKEVLVIASKYIDHTYSLL